MFGKKQNKTVKEDFGLIVHSFFPSASLPFLSSLPICSLHPLGSLLEPAAVNYALSILYILVVKDQLINHFIEDLEDSFQFLQLRVVFKYCNVFNQYVFCLPAVKEYLLASGEFLFLLFCYNTTSPCYKQHLLGKKKNSKMKYCTIPFFAGSLKSVNYNVPNIRYCRMH